MKMTLKKGLSGLLILSFLPLAGCSNIFKGPSSKTSDEAYFEDAQKAMDNMDWDTAIANMNNLSVEFKIRYDVIEAWAGAYAGKCGLDFIGYFTALGSASLTGSTLFKFLMNAFTGKVIFPSYCTLAQAKMEEISTNPLNRTAGQNLFMAVLGMVKIGVYLKKNADTNDDGIPDPTFNACSSMSVADTNEITTGLGLITTNLTYLTAAMAAGSISGALTTVNTACSLSPGACGKTDPTTVSAGDRNSVTDLLSTASTNTTAPLGIGTCVDPLVAPCCP
jgi:hypothetical protein